MSVEAVRPPLAPMAAKSIFIPQIGEGLQEARLAGVLKQPGDHIRRDEPIYQMETDKAVMDVESPYEGVLISWSAEVDAILPIGAEVAVMEVADEGDVASAPAGGPAAAAADAPVADKSRAAAIPPRTRAYAKEKGVSEADLAALAAGGGKLMPADIDAFLSGTKPAASSGVSNRAASGAGWVEEKLGTKQRVMSSRLQRGSQLVVPGTITVPIEWGGIERARDRFKLARSDFQPSSFTMFAFAVAKALADFPAFRSTLVGEDSVRRYDHVNLGVAVALPGDELVLAVVEGADALDWRTFAANMRERITEARGGKDQANESVTISLTNMQNFGLRDAVPVVVPPAVATLFLGEVYYGVDQETGEGVRRYANAALTFDHRLINGVGAAQFMAAVKEKAEMIEGMVE